MSDLPWYRPAQDAAAAETAWEGQVRALGRHPGGAERLYFGENAFDGLPVILRRDCLAAHVLVVGSSGSRKSSLSVGPLSTQVIRMPDYAALAILDIKGDAYLFASMRLAAERAGRKFRWFTPELEKATYPYNPLSGLYNPEITPEQSGQALLEAVMEFSAATKAESFFKIMNLRKLMSALKSRPIQNFADLYQALSQFSDPYEREVASEIVALVEGLAAVRALNLTSPTGIDLKEALANKEVVYFWLPAHRQPETVKLIARLVIFDLFQNASYNTPCFIAIDEFARVASPTLTVCMEQSRGLNLQFLLACQTLPADPAFRQTVWTNTQLKLIHDVVDPDFSDYIFRAFGDTTLRRAPSGIYLPVPLTNEPGRYNEITVDPRLALLHLTRDVGPSHLQGYPILLRLSDQVPEGEYRRRAALPFPAAEEAPGTIVVTRECSLPLLASEPGPMDMTRDQEALRQFEANAKRLSERLRPRPRQKGDSAS